jgi:hypothetical protein
VAVSVQLGHPGGVNEHMTLEVDPDVWLRGAAAGASRPMSE